MTAVAWTIAGSDSGGGAGIQADLKTFQAHGVHGCTAITALTAQNTQAVRRADYVSLDMIEAQLQALAEDLAPKAVKTGMLGSAAIMNLVADYLDNIDASYVCDPVMVATSGGVLMDPDAHRVLVSRLLPRADLITPNIPEAQALTGQTIDDPASMQAAAEALLAMGARSVLLKGGHDETTAFSQDFWSDGRRSFWLTGHRVPDAHTHGSGCTLAAAVAANLALGYDLDNALVLAKAFVTRGVRKAVALGGGQGPVAQDGALEHQDMPWLTDTAALGAQRPTFPDCGDEPLGFYPIIDSISWLKRLIPQGIRTVQLRIKDMTGEALKTEIEETVRLCRAHDVRLFVNDHWREAIAGKAYGVHLGQEDLETADIQAIAQAGLRLGVSTHDFYELSRALSLQPSYLALGPIYATTTKVMRFGPQGLDKLRLWRKLTTHSLVAIGGLTRERAKLCIEAGADATSVITAVTKAADPERETRAWLELWTNYSVS